MSDGPQLHVLADATEVARAGAAWIAAEIDAAVALRGRATLAVSGGRTPAAMFAELARLPVRWDRLDVFQVDERVAPPAHPDRNATQLGAALAGPIRARAEGFHWMPVTDADPGAAAARYAAALAAAAGTPPRLDIVHLGLGPDGHTASIFPGATVAEDVDVTVTGPHAGRQRMTLTLPAINRARRIVWIVTGRDKRAPLDGLLRGAAPWVASRVRRADAVVFADADAIPSST